MYLKLKNKGSVTLRVKIATSLGGLILLLMVITFLLPTIIKAEKWVVAQDSFLEGEFTDVVYNPEEGLMLANNTQGNDTIYPAFGTYISAPHDTGIDNIVYQRLYWQSNNTDDCSVGFQLRAAKTKEELTKAGWLGPEFEIPSYGISGATIRFFHNGKRWIQFKARLNSGHHITGRMMGVSFASSSAGNCTPIVKWVRTTYEAQEDELPPPTTDNRTIAPTSSGLPIPSEEPPQATSNPSKTPVEVNTTASEIDQIPDSTSSPDQESSQHQDVVEYPPEASKWDQLKDASPVIQALCAVLMVIIAFASYRHMRRTSPGTVDPSVVDSLNTGTPERVPEPEEPRESGNDQEPAQRQWDSWTAAGGPTEGNPDNISVQNYSISDREMGTLSTQINVLDHHEHWRAGFLIINAANNRRHVFHIAVGGRSESLFWVATPDETPGRAQDFWGIIEECENLNSNTITMRREGNHIHFLVNEEVVDSINGEGYRIETVLLRAWGDEVDHEIEFNEINGEPLREAE